MRRLRILVVDDHPLFREGLRWLLAAHADLALVGAAADGAAAVRLAGEVQPDLVLCDINLPDANGLDLTRQLRRLYPQILVIIVTLHADDEQLMGAIRAGAAGFLTKDAAGEELLATVRRVGRGDYPINDRVLDRPGVAARLLEQFRELGGHEEVGKEFFSPLTPRELGVLEAAAHGQSNKEIARTLGISDQTVKNHMTSILRKLVVNDRTQAVIHALRHGWITVDGVGERRQGDARGV